MKFSSIAAAGLCATAVSAAPAWGDKNNHKGYKSPFEFTSTFKVVATPDQVVNGSNVPTGGLAVSRTSSIDTIVSNIKPGRNWLL